MKRFPQESTVGRYHSDSEEQQRLFASRKLYGPVPGVTVELPSGRQPPPGPSSADPLHGCSRQLEAAEVAEVAVENTTNLAGQFASDRINLCAKCGLANWEWKEGAWVCSVCGQLACRRADNRAVDVER
jgi:hypothetical protein